MLVYENLVSLHEIYKKVYNFLYSRRSVQV